MDIEATSELQDTIIHTTGDPVQKLKTLLEGIETVIACPTLEIELDSTNWLENLKDNAWDYNALEEALKAIDNTDREENAETIQAAEKKLAEAEPIISEILVIDENSRFRALKALKKSIIESKVRFEDLFSCLDILSMKN